MTTNDDQYVPSEDDVRIAYVDEWVAQSDFLTRHQEREAERAGEAAWDRFLARVRRDAWEEGAQAQADTYGGQIDTGPTPTSETRTREEPPQAYPAPHRTDRVRPRRHA